MKFQHGHNCNNGHRFSRNQRMFRFSHIWHSNARLFKLWKFITPEIQVLQWFWGHFWPSYHSKNYMGVLLLSKFSFGTGLVKIGPAGAELALIPLFELRSSCNFTHCDWDMQSKFCKNFKGKLWKTSELWIFKVLKVGRRCVPPPPADRIRRSDNLHSTWVPATALKWNRAYFLFHSNQNTMKKV